MTQPIDLEKLKACAQAATQGEWHWHGHRPYAATPFGDSHLDGLFGNEWRAEDRAFTSAFHPQTALALLDRLERCERVVAEAQIAVRYVSINGVVIVEGLREALAALDAEGGA